MTTILHSGSQRCAQLCRFALMLGLGLSGATASATEWQIPSPNDGNAAAVTALTNALANCGNNDIVTLSSGVYDLAGIVSHSNETYGASHLLTPSSKTITLRGDPSLDREDVVLKGDGTARILFLKKVGCKIENISFTNGFAKTGAVVHTDASLPGKAGLCDLSNCVFRCNVSDSNAGVAYGATLYNCLAESNRAKTNAGVIQYAKVFNTTFRRNSAKNGGACYQTDAMGCVFEEHSSESDGGALTYTCTASNCVFRFNSAGGAGGAGNGSYAIRDCRFIGNSSVGNGGALSGQQKDVSGCWFESNWARGANQHGAIYGVGANILVQDCIFTNNAAGKGNGVGQDVAVWSNCLFVANQMRAVEKGQAGVSGGTFYNCVFRGQWSAAAGSNSQSPTNSYAESRRWQQMLSVRNGTLFDCTIEGCVTNCVMTRCTIAGCTNTPVVIFGTAALTNCLVAGNRTVSDASVNQPLGLFYGDTSGAGISLVNCTVADNQGTVFNNVGGNIANTIFFGNTEADITAKGTYGTALTFDHCLYRTCQSTASTEPVFSDCVVLGASETPKFNEMEDDAYPYYMTRPSSKSVNAGKAIAWESGAVDLCGNPRVRDDLVDIGCYESVIPRHSFIIIIR